MDSKFSKEERDKFMKDLEAMGLESDSELEDSFFEKQTNRMKAEIEQVRHYKDQTALEELKRNMKEQDEMMTQYERERQQLHQITSNKAKNVIDQGLLSEIKIKVQRQTNNSSLILADELYNQSVLAQQAQPQKTLPNTSFIKVKKAAEEKMKKVREDELRIQKKIEAASQQRQYIAMEQEDKLSYQFEMECLSNLFKERFLVPKFPKVTENHTSVKLSFTKLPPSYVRLNPQQVSEETVLPRNSPSIALKQLKKNRPRRLKPSQFVEVKVESHVLTLEKASFQKADEEDENPEQKDNDIQRMFKQYMREMHPLVSEIEKIALDYNPHFLRYLREEEKNLNYEFEEKQGGLKDIRNVACLENGRELCQLKLSFEKLTSLEGIQVFCNAEECQLQFNMLQSVDNLSACSKLIQLNLSHNRIRDISSIQSLKWLRLINVENNLIEELNLSGLSLEIVIADHNRIASIDVNKSQRLRILRVAHNRLHQLPKLKLLGLEELSVANNQLSRAEGLRDLILLKKLDLSSNRISRIDQISFLFLNQLNLAGNGLKNIQNLFLPCLQELRLNNNKLESRGKGLSFLPNLKEINIDDNRLGGFGFLWWLLRCSRGAQIIRYGNNEYFLGLREKVRQVYEAMLYKQFHSLKILNDAPYDSGLAQYYRQNYSIYFDGAVFFADVDPTLTKMEAIIRLILRESTFSLTLQAKNDPFAKQQAYIDYQWNKQVVSLAKVIQLSQDNLRPICIVPTLFYRYDFHQAAKRRLSHLLRGLILKKKYRQTKRIKYYQKQRPIIEALISQLTKQYFQSQTSKIVRKFAELIRGMNENVAATKIQKVWKGYVRRKIYKKLKNSKEDSDIEDVDIDFFDNELEKIEFDIDLQDFEDIIIRPEVFQMLEAKRQERSSKFEPKKDQNEDKQPLKNNFLDSRTKIPKPGQSEKKEPNEAEKLMKQWKITDPRVLKALQFKQQKKDEMKRKQMEKNLTAAERYERFKRGGH